MNDIDNIQMNIQSHILDSSASRNGESIWEIYSQGCDETKGLIDNFFICLVGWSMTTLMEKSEDDAGCIIDVISDETMMDDADTDKETDRLLGYIEDASPLAVSKLNEVVRYLCGTTGDWFEIAKAA